MGAAIMKGICNCKELASGISLYGYDLDTEKMKSLEEYGVTACADENELVSKCGCVFFAVKPQMLESVLEKCGKSFTSDKIIVSICAGVSESIYRRMTVPDAKVVLVMPNTPLLLGEGATALANAGNVTADEFEFVKSIFSSCGLAVEVPVDRMKEIIAVNGSSPAFIYLFAKGFVDYASSVGINADDAKALFCKSLIGSAKMMTDSGYSIDELIRMVSSPGGTTLKGLDELYAGKLTEVVTNACESCTKRAYELAK